MGRAGAGNKYNPLECHIDTFGESRTLAEAYGRARGVSVAAQGLKGFAS